MKTITINRGLEERRSRSGKVRRTIRIDAEPMTINVDPKMLGQPIANAIAHHFRERIRGITEKASPATIRMRQTAAKAFAAGEAWALKRYSGGRTGAKPPNQSDRLFNDSGRFADSIAANASSDGAWRVNVAGNRLDDSFADRIWNRLVQLVPEFANLSLLFDGNSLLRRTMENVSRERIKIGRNAATQFQAFAATLFAA
jgi:hypothetical protein